jgi:5-oxoprolinase (ATP-hydrolysing) subunit C
MQAPGNGLPIILLADAQTTGGYPKIATVIRADLARLAACVPGDMLRFTGVTVAEAEAAARAQDRHLAEVEASLAEVAGAIRDPATLLGLNLIGGMVDMTRPDHFPGHISDPDE